MKDIRLITQEIEKHIERLKYAKNKIESWNLSKDILNDPEKIETVDSFIFRFTKMQDAMGEKLFPVILMIMEEEYRNRPFIDIINRLEQLEVIPSASGWKKLREVRNALARTYPWEHDILIDAIQKACIYSEVIISIFEKIKRRIEKFL